MDETTQQQFSNDQVEFSVHKKPGCIVEFQAKVSGKVAQEAKRQAIKKVAKEVTLPGFRKGKAPEPLILKNYPKQVEKAWQDEIANVAFPLCDKLAGIPLVNNSAKISYQMKNFSNDGAELTFAFETDPTPPSVDAKEMTLQAVKRPDVNEEKVDETIRQAQFFFANWKVITERPAQAADIVTLDVDIIETTPHQPLFSNTRFEITDRSMAKWMQELCVGKKVGEAIEGVSGVDDSLTEEEKANFQPKKVKITIKAIMEATLPTLDDEFASKLGVKTLDELKKIITDLLNKQADGHVKKGLRDQVEQFLLTHYQFDIPRTLIERETQFRLKQLSQDKEFQSHWDQLSSEERKKTIQSVHEQSTKAVRMFYLCKKILADGQITITPQDLHQQQITPLEMLLFPSQDHLQGGDSEIHQAEVYSRVMLEKVEDYLIAQSQSLIGTNA